MTIGPIGPISVQDIRNEYSSPHGDVNLLRNWVRLPNGPVSLSDFRNKSAYNDVTLISLNHSAVSYNCSGVRSNLIHYLQKYDFPTGHYCIYGFFQNRDVMWGVISWTKETNVFTSHINSLAYSPTLCLPNGDLNVPADTIIIALVVIAYKLNQYPQVIRQDRTLAVQKTTDIELSGHDQNQNMFFNPNLNNRRVALGAFNGKTPTWGTVQFGWYVAPLRALSRANLSAPGVILRNNNSAWTDSVVRMGDYLQYKTPLSNSTWSPTNLLMLKSAAKEGHTGNASIVTIQSLYPMGHWINLQENATNSNKVVPAVGGIGHLFCYLKYDISNINAQASASGAIFFTLKSTGADFTRACRIGSAVNPTVSGFNITLPPYQPAKEHHSIAKLHFNRIYLYA